MDDWLDRDFDAVVLGTGLTESLVAAALARAGKQVLHLDRNDYYGGEYASLSLEQYLEWHSKLLATPGETGTSSGSGDDGSGAEAAATPPSLEKVLAEVNRPRKPKPTGAPDGGDGGDGDGDGDGPEEDGDGGKKAGEDPRGTFRFKSVRLEPMCGASGSTTGWRTFEAVPLTSSADGSDVPPPAELVAASRDFLIDISPRVTLCRGTLVDVLVRTNLGSYVEFKTLDSTFVYLPAAAGFEASGASGAKSTAAGAAAQSAAVAHVATGDQALKGLCKVPCSKADVFQSSFLSLMERRVLMKFLQFCMDFHTQAAGSTVETRNEESLGQGRSLTRPQNKAKTSYDYEGFKDKPFGEFLSACKLSRQLQDIISHAVALIVLSQRGADAVPGAGDTHVSTEEGMSLIVRYVKSMGRFGTTAFIVSMYGVSELPQAFCRMCAVNGGIYMLRTEPVALALGDGEIAQPPATKESQLYPASTSSKGDNDHSAAGSGEGGGDGSGSGGGDAATGPSGDSAKDGAGGAVDVSDTCAGVVCADGRVIRARHVVAGAEYLPQFLESDARQCIVRCVATIDAPLLPDVPRMSVVIPPLSAPFGNAAAVQVVQVDGSCRVVPDNKYLLYLSTVWGHDEPGDSYDADAGAPMREHESAKVLLSVLDHLTRRPATVAPALAGDSDEGAATDTTVDGSPLESKAGDLSEVTSTPSADGGGATTDDGEAKGVGSAHDKRPVCLWKSMFVQNIPYAKRGAHLPANVLVAHPVLGRAESGGGVSAGTSAPDYVQPAHASPLRLHHEEAVSLAASLFERLCPGEEFLPEVAPPDEDSDIELPDEAKTAEAEAPTAAEEASDGKQADELTAGDTTTATPSDTAAGAAGADEATADGDAPPQASAVQTAGEAASTTDE